MMTSKLGFLIKPPSKLSWNAPWGKCGMRRRIKRRAATLRYARQCAKAVPTPSLTSSSRGPPRVGLSWSSFHRGGRKGTQPALLAKVSGRANLMPGSFWLSAPTSILTTRVSPPSANSLQTRSMRSHLTASNNLHTYESVPTDL